MEYLLPLALTFGMPIREFWNEEPELLWAYRKSYMDKIKIENELANERAWIQGLYFYNALSVSIYNSFGRKDGDQAENYISKPIDFNKLPKSEKEIEEEKQKKLEEQIKASLRRGVIALNKNK